MDKKKVRGLVSKGIDAIGLGRALFTTLFVSRPGHFYFGVMTCLLFAPFWWSIKLEGDLCCGV